MQKLLYGTAYYAEYLPGNRAAEDMRMMREAGMNVVRIAESTWATYEPTEGAFDFSPVIRVLREAERQGLSVIVGTPTYAVPAWLVRRCPSVLADTHQGRRPYGARQQMDITDKQYLFYAERVIRRLMEAVRPYRCVIGFQLDNETKHYDTCGEQVQRRFVAWLRGRFGTLQRLNEALGLDYWSNRIGSWEDFPDVRGTINGSLACAFSEFQRELVTEFLAWQADIVRQYARPEQFLTHNFDFEWCGWSFGVQPDVAHNLAVRRLDLAGCDIYHPSQDDLTGREISFCGDLARCLKQAPYLVAETEAQGFPQWTPYPGQLRLQALMHLACGALGVMYWHWHSLHNGFETYWKGVMSHDMLPNPVYGEAKAVGAAFERLSDPLYGMRKPCRTAILVSNTALSAVERFRIPGGGPEGGLQYNDVVRWMYDACYDENLEMDVIFPDAEFSSYALLIAPCLYAADESLLARLRAYVEGGGHLVATFKLGFCDENVRVRPQPQPAGLRDVFGAGYSQFAAADGVYLDDGTAVSAWMELLTPEGADVLRRYDHPAWGGYAAVTRNRFGLGSAAYIGCMADGLYLRGLMREEAALAGIAPPDLRFPLIARSGWTDGRAVRFLLNFSGGERRIAWPFESCDDLLNGGGWEHGASVVLPPWGALIGKER